MFVKIIKEPQAEDFAIVYTNVYNCFISFAEVATSSINIL